MPRLSLYESSLLMIQGEACAAARGLSHRMRFMAADFAQLSESAELTSVELVVALHACGGLTDLALHFAATRLDPLPHLEASSSYLWLRIVTKPLPLYFSIYLFFRLISRLLQL